MASKHAKLKLALTRAIIDFFLQEDLYADELKIQGTVCVTADRSAIFVTQITETVNEGLQQEAGPSNYTNDGHINHYQTQNDSPEDLTCKSGSQSTPPVAHTKTHHGIHKNPPFGKHALNLLHSPPVGSQKPEWSHGGNFCGGGDFPRDAPGHDLTSYAPTRFSLLEKEDHSNNQLVTLNNAILNAAAKSAIQRLTSLNREKPKNHTAGEWGEAPPSTTPLNNTEKEPIHEVMDCSSSKKRRIDKPTILQQPLDSNLNHRDKEANSPNIDQPLMLVTPKREKISDDESEMEIDNERSNLSGTSGEPLATKLLTVTGLDLSPHSDSGRKAVSPSGGGGGGAQTGASSAAPWTFTVASMKEEPGTLVTEWSSADWMRKPRTKFSQDQLHALEMEYKTDPFLSTSADKRSELARRLNITEKNVQIWFQNQRRRRRAAAYSQMHYTLSDAKTTSFNNNGTEDNIDNNGESSDHEDSSPPPGKEREKEKEEEEEGGGGEGSRPGSVCSLADSSSSELVIATDLSPEGEGEEEEEEVASQGEKEGEENGEENGKKVIKEREKESEGKRRKVCSNREENEDSPPEGGGEGEGEGEES